MWRDWVGEKYGLQIVGDRLGLYFSSVERLIEYRSFTREDAEKRIEAQKSRRGIGNVEEEVKNGVVTAIIEIQGVWRN